MDQDPRLCDVGVYQKRVKVWVRLRLKRVGVKVAAVRDPRWLISAERVRLWKREKKRMSNVCSRILSTKTSLDLDCR